MAAVNSQVIVIPSTFGIPVVKLNKNGDPTPKTLGYAIETDLGSNSHIVKVSLTEFSTGTKEPKIFIEFTLDHKLNVAYVAHNVNNSKNFLKFLSVETTTLQNVVNLTELVLDHFLNIDLTLLKSDNTDKSWVLLYSLFPLLESEIDKLSDLKTGSKRKLKTLTQDAILKVWAKLSDYGDPLLTSYIDYAKANSK